MRLYFGTNSFLINIDNRQFLNGTVLFKPKGTIFVTAKAKLIEITGNRPTKDKRLLLPDGEVREDHRTYYGFEELEKLPKPIPLSSLRRYASGKVVRNDVPGCCFVRFMTDKGR